MSEGKELFDKLKEKTAEFMANNPDIVDSGVYFGHDDLKQKPVAYLDLEKISPSSMAYATGFVANEKQSPVYAHPAGEVVVTTNAAGDCVAVTRQDKDGKILSVIWERDNHVPDVGNMMPIEPFGYFKSEPFGWTDCAEDDEGAVALYEKI